MSYGAQLRPSRSVSEHFVEFTRQESYVCPTDCGTHKHATAAAPSRRTAAPLQRTASVPGYGDAHGPARAD